MGAISENDSLNDNSSDLSELFTPVMTSIRLDLLAECACKIRKSPNGSPKTAEFGPLMFGSYHVLYPLEFDDEVRWLLKVPMNGTREKFSDLDARSIRSEALTMRYLEKRTTIPIPYVFAFSGSCNNELNCPFILMDYIDGKPLYDIWFDKTQPNDIIGARRTKCLQGLAAAMVQLSRFSFEQAGSLSFGESNDDVDNDPFEIGPMRLPNKSAMLERMKDDEYDGLPIYLEAGPFRDPKDYFTALLVHRQNNPTTDFMRGQLILLRMLLDWIPEPELGNGSKPFVLTHPDLDIQNVLVAEDGTLQGIIDWDGVCAVPRSIGNESFPSWLTRDWDPSMVGWNEDMERGIEPPGVWEDSPETLRKYRSTYMGFIQSSATPRNPLFGLTRNSIICENLLIAANDPVCTFGILRKVFSEIHNVVRAHLPHSASTVGDLHNPKDGDAKGDEDGLENFDIFNILWALGEKRLSEHYSRLLKYGFHLLLEGDEVL